MVLFNHSLRSTMSSKRISGASMRLMILVVTFLAFQLARAAEPHVESTEFDQQPTGVHYFEDSNVVLLPVFEEKNVWRSTDGGLKWHLLGEEDNGISEGEVAQIYMSPANNRTAIAIGTRRRHWITHDQGEHWKGFEVSHDIDGNGPPPVSFHAGNSDLIILNTGKEGSGRVAWYTDDGFEKKPKNLLNDARQCIWAREKSEFNADADTTALCIVEKESGRGQDETTLLYSDDFFKDGGSPFQPDGERTVHGVYRMVAVKSYVLAARSAPGTKEMAMYATKDGKNWHRALFGHQKLEANGYTVMESRNYSVQVDVITGPSDRPMGMLYSSNSDGTDFTQIVKYTNRAWTGIVDFENLQSIQGTVMVNLVANGEAVEADKDVEKKIISQISFNDGRDFQNLRTENKKNLHVHSMSEPRNSGRIFSSPVPGLVMAVGNTGDSLKGYNDGDLYVSENGGISWRLALENAHKYEFGGAGSVLVAVYDEGVTDVVNYSLDYGRTWKELDLGAKVTPQLLTTVPDSTSLKFILMAIKGRGGDATHQIFTLDFETLGLPSCDDSDFEDWTARKDEGDDDSGCIMGHKQVFHRRKPKAKCLVKDLFNEPLPDNSEKCPCGKQDFECAYGFSVFNGTCLPTNAVAPPKGACKAGEESFEGYAYRLIPGNTCNKKHKSSKNLDEDEGEFPCNTSTPSVDGQPKATLVSLSKTKHVLQKVYLERSETSNDKDETIFTLMSNEELMVTHDHGKTWDSPLPDVKVLTIFKNYYNEDNVYFITASNKVYYSLDRGYTINEFNAPSRPNLVGFPILRFHAKNEKWLLWTGCAPKDSKNCQPTVYRSLHNGDEWQPLLKSVENCEFMYRPERKNSEKLVYCEAHKGESEKGPKELLASEDWFESKPKVLFGDMLRFATMSEFIVVAAKDDDEGKFLKVDSSIDGKTFADAQFPANFQVDHQTSYTVLDSSTHAIFLHVTESEAENREYGSIIKSNSNGTFFTMSARSVNRSPYGFVDFEKMLGLEGVAVVNVVENREEVDEGSRKRLQTMITHNDGAEWNLITPPVTDANNEKYKCSSSDLNECALHLHGYTERVDFRDTASSPSAVGLMFGIGNVGKYLEDIDTTSYTFMSTDGGFEWKTIRNGHYSWEVGDQGSIIVLVDQIRETKVIHFSRNEGKTWTEFEFAEETLLIDDITTVPSDTSRNFLLWGRKAHSERESVTINLDFTTLTSRQCQDDEKYPGSEKDDYEMWTPRHPHQSNGCLFGHEAQYRRKKVDRDCYNGPRIEHEVGSPASWANCTCTRQDYECNYNYERKADGTCVLVAGLEAPDAKKACETKGVKYYYDATSMRKLPLSTCNENELDQGEVHPCPGYENDPDIPKSRRSISAAGLFFAIVIPILVAGGVAYFAWKRWGHSKVGRIRLGDTSTSSSRESPWVQWPVAILSALVAAAMAIPMVIGSLYRGIRERVGRRRERRSATYTSRGSFARGRAGYATNGNIESDLLGEDSDDEA